MDLQVNSAPISGLQRAVTRDDFVLARKVCDSQLPIRNVIANSCSYNNLPEDNVLIEIEEKVQEHLPQLRMIFEKFGVENVLGVNALHRHDIVLDGFHLAGKAEIRDTGLQYLTEAVEDAHDPNQVCGLKFTYDSEYGSWTPYEFHKGPLPGTISQVDPKFFLQFTDYLVTHNLTSVLGLMYIPKEMLTYDMIEFVFPNCVMVQTPMLVTDITTTVTTGWRFPEPNLTRKTHCVPDRDTTHPPPNDLLLQHYQISINGKLSEIDHAFVKGQPKFD
jgi:hypothetical protein